MQNANHNTTVRSNTPIVSNVAGDSFEPLDERLAELGEVLGEIKAYDNALELAEIAGTRTVKFLYQVNKKTGNKVAENSYTRIPTAHLTSEVVVENAERLAPYVLAFLQEHEAAMLKEDHRAGIASIYVPSLGLDKIVARMDKLELGGRVTKEMITAWFTAEIQGALSLLFMDKMGTSADEITPEQVAKLESILVAYRTKFETLAGGKASIKPADCVAMSDIVIKCGADSTSLGGRFITRLEKMSTAVEDILETL